MRSVWRFVGRIWDDVLGLIGFVCVAHGLSLWSVPAAWIVSGCLLMAIAILPHLRKGQP